MNKSSRVEDVGYERALSSCKAHVHIMSIFAAWIAFMKSSDDITLQKFIPPNESKELSVLYSVEFDYKSFIYRTQFSLIDLSVILQRLTYGNTDKIRLWRTLDRTSDLEKIDKSKFERLFNRFIELCEKNIESNDSKLS